MLIASARDPHFSPEQTSVCLKDLRDLPFITMLQNNVFFQDITYALCQTAGFFPKIFAQTDNIFFKLHMVQEGLAVALLPESGLFTFLRYFLLSFAGIGLYPLLFQKLGF